MISNYLKQLLNEGNTIYTELSNELRKHNDIKFKYLGGKSRRGGTKNYHQVHLILNDKSRSVFKDYINGKGSYEHEEGIGYSKEIANVIEIVWDNNIWSITTYHFKDDNNTRSQVSDRYYYKDLNELLELVKTL
jgi:hypothetical protein